MGGQINNYSLGRAGVNVDKSAVHLNDDELTSAQNATRDPHGHDGGLVNRKGLTKFNATGLGASINGGTGINLVNRNSTLIGLAGGAVETLLFSGATALGNGAADTPAWFQTTNQGGTVTQPATTLIANPRGRFVTRMGTNTENYFAGRLCAVWNNRVYYVGQHTEDSEEPVIRVFDGVDDYEFVRIPYNPDVGASTFANCVSNVITANGKIYFTTLDKDDSPMKGRVFQLDPKTGVLTPLGATFPDDQLPYALAWAYGQLFVSTVTCATGIHAYDAAGRVYRIRPGIDSAFTLDTTWTDETQSHCAVDMISYGGRLYAALNAEASAVADGDIYVRDSAGAWTESLDGSFNAAGYAGFWSLAIFGGNLYASQKTAGVSSAFTLHKFDGSTWSTVYTHGSTFATAAPYLFATQGYIYAVVPNIFSVSTPVVLRSADGTTWTDISANFPSPLICGGFAALYL